MGLLDDKGMKNSTYGKVQAHARAAQLFVYIFLFCWKCLIPLHTATFVPDHSKELDQ